MSSEKQIEANRRNAQKKQGTAHSCRQSARQPQQPQTRIVHDQPQQSALCATD